MNDKALNIKRSRSPGTLEDVRLIQWRAVSAAEEAMFASARQGDTSGVLRSVHAITQAAACYTRLVETVELVSRIEVLQEELRELRAASGLRKVV